MRLLEKLGLTAPPPAVNTVLQMISRRAERLDPEQQAETFVTVGGIERTLLNPDHRIIFGRRGTGKTHVLSHVANETLKRGDTPLLIDLRTIGSNSYMYSDDSKPVRERLTLLLRDFVSAVHDAFLDRVTAPNTAYDARRLSPLIDQLGKSIQEVVVLESLEIRESQQASKELTVGGEGAASAGSLLGSFALRAKGERKQSGATSLEYVEKGLTRLSVNFGQLSQAVADLGERIGSRVWLLLDEWSTLPEPLQPYVADFIKRVFYPCRNYTVHIAAIEQRSRFRAQGSTGIELGADAFADVNLDDYLVFENSPERSIAFFREMLYRHVAAVWDGGSPPKSAADFLRLAFTQEPTFRELVRACEGVPRDAINILQIAAARAQDERISVPHIREAAKDWYERDKATYVRTNPEADALLQWIIKTVIGDRKARAFLVKSEVRNDTLERLFDERILHLAKKSYSTKEDPGTRYRVWKIDYGCYVDLINTSKAPTGFLAEGIDVDWQGNIVVPEDDLRAIRRAVLDLDVFSRQYEPPGAAER